LGERRGRGRTRREQKPIEEKTKKGKSKMKNTEAARLLNDSKLLVERCRKKGLMGMAGDLPPELAAASSRVTVEWMEVTPELAQGWLAHNGRNRRIRETVVKAYAADMKNGNWLPTHQGIAIDTENNLIDGQHRLSAIVASGMTVKMLVTRGLPGRPKGKRITTMDAVDRGAIRSVKDQLQLQHGVKNAYLTAACVCTIAQLCVIPKKQGRVTMNQTLAIMELFGEHIEWMAENCQGIRNITTAPVLGALSLARAVMKERAESFTQALSSGAGLADSSPVLHLRNWLLMNASEFNKGNNSDRATTSRKVLNALWLVNEKKKCSSVKELNGEEWKQFLEAQTATVASVREVLGAG
jgi:hypothetical protein